MPLNTSGEKDKQPTKRKIVNYYKEKWRVNDNNKAKNSHKKN